MADRYYGVDRQYFTTVIDYGFSKRLDEALEKWGRENVLRDVVRVIRIERPFVLIARFQGNERDGHGNHQAAGLDHAGGVQGRRRSRRCFPSRSRQGLRPWQPLKLYMGGVRENEDWTLRVDTGVYRPVARRVLPDVFARSGLSFQRSQNGGAFLRSPDRPCRTTSGSQSIVDAPAKETSFFDGIDTTIPGIYTALRKTAPSGAEAALQAIDREIKAAIQSFKMVEPFASTPALARALGGDDAAQRQLGGDPDVASVLAAEGTAASGRHPRHVRCVVHGTCTTGRHRGAHRSLRGIRTPAGDAARCSRPGVRGRDDVYESQPDRRESRCE